MPRLLITLLCISALSAIAQPAARPNILFCIADDWGYPHAGAYGDKAAKTPAFDKLAKEGALFTRAFSAAPSCTASRASILTGQAPHRLGVGTNLWSDLPAKYAVYPELLEKSGYAIGKMRKAWGPGKLQDRPRDPAGPNFKSFEDFLKAAPGDKPFCFWLGSPDPHRPYERAFGQASGIDPKSVTVPPYIPDTAETRADIVDYLAEVQRFDSDVAAAIDLLEKKGLANNTIVVATGDNGWPWPHSKANLYDTGTRQPLAVRWPGKIKPGTVIDRLTILTDLAPTFLELSGNPIPADMTGQSLVSLLKGETVPQREAIFVERERHAKCREGNVGYPMRAIRTEKYLYIRNFFPDRWPAGDPDQAYSQGIFGDIDAGPTKWHILEKKDDPAYANYLRWATAKRPAEELFEVTTDPHSLKNLADDPKLAETKKELAAKLQTWMTDTKDLRATDPQTTAWDTYEYYSPEKRK